MTAAAQTSEPTNPQTGAERLLAFARWLVTLLFVHFLIVRGREFAADLRQHPTASDHPQFARRFGTTDLRLILARINRGLRRAAALEAELLALRPIEHGFSIEARRAIAAELIDICRDLGVFRAKPATTLAKHAQPRFFALAFGVPPIPGLCTRSSLCESTGPP